MDVRKQYKGHLIYTLIGDKRNTYTQSLFSLDAQLRGIDSSDLSNALLDNNTTRIPLHTNTQTHCQCSTGLCLLDRSQSNHIYQASFIPCPTAVNISLSRCFHSCLEDCIIILDLFSEKLSYQLSHAMLYVEYEKLAGTSTSIYLFIHSNSVTALSWSECHKWEYILGGTPHICMLTHNNPPNSMLWGCEGKLKNPKHQIHTLCHL